MHLSRQAGGHRVKRLWQGLRGREQAPLQLPFFWRLLQAWGVLQGEAVWPGGVLPWKRDSYRAGNAPLAARVQGRQ